MSIIRPPTEPDLTVAIAVAGRPAGTAISIAVPNWGQKRREVHLDSFRWLGVLALLCPFIESNGRHKTFSKRFVVRFDAIELPCFEIRIAVSHLNGCTAPISPLICGIIDRIREIGFGPFFHSGLVVGVRRSERCLLLPNGTEPCCFRKKFGNDP